MTAVAIAIQTSHRTSNFAARWSLEVALWRIEPNETTLDIQARASALMPASMQSVRCGLDTNIAAMVIASANGFS